MMQVHCENCNEIIPITEFNSEYHQFGICKQLKQSEWEKLPFKEKYIAELGSVKSASDLILVNVRRIILFPVFSILLIFHPKVNSLCYKIALIRKNQIIS